MKEYIELIWLNRAIKNAQEEITPRISEKEELIMLGFENLSYMKPFRDR